MNPFIIGIASTVIILALLFGKPVVDTIRKVRANKKIRTEMFECIGSEWIMRMNSALKNLIVDRDPDLPVQERPYEKNSGWMILIPMRNVGTGAKFALVIGATTPIPKPKPHVKTILMDIIVVTRDKSEWWLEGRCDRTFPSIKKELDKQGVIFDIAEKDPS